MVFERREKSIKMSKNMTLSAARIIATIFILICHIIKFYTFIPGHNQLGQFFNVGVPMFIIISGYLYGVKYGDKEKEINIKQYIKDRFFRVVFPSQIWALCILIVTCGAYLFNTFTVLLNIQGIGWIITNNNFLDGGPYLSHSWFVTVIILCYGMVPFLQKYCEKIKCWYFVILYAIGVLLQYVHINIFYFLLFVVAFYFSKKKYEMNQTRMILVSVIFVVAIIFRVLAQQLIDNSILYNDVIVILTHHVLAATIIIFISRIVNYNSFFKSLVMCNMSRFIENHSYSIYLVHFSLISLLYDHLPLGTATLLFFAFTGVLSFLLDYLVLWISKLFKNDKELIQ